MNRVMFSVLAAVGSVAIVGSAQATVLLQDNFDGAAGTDITTTGWVHEYQPLLNPPSVPLSTGAISGALVDSGNSAVLSGSGTAWSKYFTTPYTLQAGDTVTALVAVSLPHDSPTSTSGDGMRVDRLTLSLHGTDSADVGARYDLTAYDYMCFVSNNGAGAAYNSNLFVWGYGSTQVWLKMVYNSNTHTLTNYAAQMSDPTNWTVIGTDNTLSMKTFTGVGIAGGDYNYAGTTTQSFDSVSVVVDSVPEPTTIALFGLAVMGLAARRRKA